MEGERMSIYVELSCQMRLNHDKSSEKFHYISGTILVETQKCISPTWDVFPFPEAGRALNINMQFMCYQELHDLSHVFLFHC